MKTSAVPAFADLHLLTVLGETRSYTQAARRLGISKASVSGRIAELERTAGVPLVRRTTRSVGLTQAGQVDRRLVIIQINTPGGLDASMRRINAAYDTLKQARAMILSCIERPNAITVVDDGSVVTSAGSAAGIGTLALALLVGPSVELSFWLLAFSMFIFLSLAIIKRYTELDAMQPILQRLHRGRWWPARLSGEGESPAGDQ